MATRTLPAPHSPEEQPHFGGKRSTSMTLPGLPQITPPSPVAFMRAVEDASRRHDLWIVSETDKSQWPVIGDGFEEVAGYRVAYSPGITTFDLGLKTEMPRGPKHVPRWIQQFVVELTLLSLKHGLWIRAAGPDTWPRLIQLNSDERHLTAHYIVRKTKETGGEFVTNLAH